MPHHSAAALQIARCSPETQRKEWQRHCSRCDYSSFASATELETHPTASAMPPRDGRDSRDESAEAEIEVFSKSLNAWVPGKVWLFASAGRITVTYTIKGQRCRKHLLPWTQQIRSVGELLEMDPDSSPAQEVRVVGDTLPSWELEEEADPDFSFTHLFDALFCEMPVNATLKNAMQAAAQKQEVYCSTRIHEASAAYASAQVSEAEACSAESGEFFEDMQDLDFQRSIVNSLRLVSHMEASSLRIWCGRPMALDVVQGRECPNCGLLVAMAAIADHHDGYLVRQLFPQFQHWDGHEDPPLNSSGCYVVSLFLHTKNSNLERFKKHHPSLKAGQDRIILDATSRSETLTKGSWRSIVIDDKLPVDSMGRLENCQFSRNKVWPSLLEKAFAKVCGSYGKTAYVGLADALVMLTGQSTFQVDLRELFNKEKRQLWKDLSEYQRSGILMTAAIYDDSSLLFGQADSMTGNGLQRNHAYTVLETLSIILDLTGEVLSLVKLRDPHGRTTYSGPWCPRCPRWTASLRQKIHGTDRGVFCMTWQDFLATFDEINICKVGDRS